MWGTEKPQNRPFELAGFPEYLFLPLSSHCRSQDPGANSKRVASSLGIFFVIGNGDKKRPLPIMVGGERELDLGDPTAPPLAAPRVGTARGELSTLTSGVGCIYVEHPRNSTIKYAKFQYKHSIDLDIEANT